MAADPSDVDDDAFLYGDSNGDGGAGGVEEDQADHPEPVQQTEEPAAVVESEQVPEQAAEEEGGGEIRLDGEEEQVEASAAEEVNGAGAAEDDDVVKIEGEATTADPDDTTAVKQEAAAAADDDDSDDSEDDNINIQIDKQVIEEAKNPYQTIGVGLVGKGRPGGVITGQAGAGGLAAEKKGKFNVEDFEQPGQVNGKEPHEMDMEQVAEQEKPWKKPGADITDYFNYGFTEETWQAYCQRQRRIRLGESGAGLPLPPGVTALPPGGAGLKPAIPTHHPSVIPTLGGGGGLKGDKLDTTKPPPVAAPAAPDVPTAISVMTSDKRTYSKKVMDAGGPPPTIDFSVPPPGMAGPPPGMPPPSIPPPGFQHPHPPPEAFDYGDQHQQPDYEFYGSGYEPTQESQWSVPPPGFDGPPPPQQPHAPHSDAPPGDAGYEGGAERDPWGQRDHSRRHSRGNSPPPPRPRGGGRDYSRDDSSRKRRRSRSRSPRESSRSYRDRDDYRTSERGDRGGDRDHRGGYGESRDRDRSDRRRDREERRRDRSRSRSRSPAGGHKHKKSKRDRSEKKDKPPPQVEVKREIKEEPAD